METKFIATLCSSTVVFIYKRVNELDINLLLLLIVCANSLFECNLMVSSALVMVVASSSIAFLDCLPGSYSLYLQTQILRKIKLKIQLIQGTNESALPG